MRDTYLGVVVAATVLYASASVGLADGPIPQPWHLSGFDQPESIIHDSERERLIVSNINGSPGEANGEGYLSIVTMDGQSVTREWVRGLDAPKGMAIYGNQLFVADLQRLHIVDLIDGSIVRTINVPEAHFLNDVTVDASGVVYVSDLMDHAIYRFSEGELSLWLRDEQLSHPNGVLVRGSNLYVGSWGRGMNSDFTTEEPGKLLSVDLDSQRISIVPGAHAIGNIDGIVDAGDALILSDWVSGNLHRVDFAGHHKVLGRVGEGIADIGAADGWIYFPFMLDGAIEAHPVSDLSALPK